LLDEQVQAARLSASLAFALKDACYAAWNSDPSQCVAAADALSDLAARLADPEVAALAEWAQGIAALAQGKMEAALARLDAAAAGFTAIGKADLAAETQVPKIAALAMLGRYDEAEACGFMAREAFVREGNVLAAGKVELNLGHIHLRRDRYADAEASFRSAHDLLMPAQDEELKIAAQVALADALIWQRRFTQAACLYEAAIASAEANGLRAQQATAQLNYGVMEQLRGNYLRALQLLESARRLHAALDMPYQTATASQYLADAYLGLNMASEALSLYDKAIPLFEEEGMRYEQAWMLAHRGQALMRLEHDEDARRSLASARALFEQEENPACAAMVDVLWASLDAAQGNADAALRRATQAEAALAQANALSWMLMAGWLRGEAAHLMGNADAARTLLQKALADAQSQFAPDVVRRCVASLGLVASAQGDAALARAHFAHAVAMTETQRTTLPGEEFRTAFASDKLTPYFELVRLDLHEGNAWDALVNVERARARALLDMLHGQMPSRLQPQDETEGKLLARIEDLRAELNWCYTQLHERQDVSAHTREALAAMARECEAQLHEVTLQLQQHGSPSTSGEILPLNLAQLQASLGDGTALVAYHVIDDELMAFVVTDKGVQAVQHLAQASAVEKAVSQVRFQMDALRHGAASMAAHMPQLLRRSQHYLRQLHDALLSQVLPLVGARRLVIVPHRALHYAPFGALFDGEAYAVEQREICTVPSAAVLQHCLSRPHSAWKRAALFGASDERAPSVREEVRTLATLFAQARTVLDGEATLATLRECAPTADVLHLACHGVFRPDSPFFSTLRLGDGWMTVRDAYDLNLSCGLVTLSACETGVSAVAPGDELIGLARGFMAAGAPTMLVSLWRVDDTVTTGLMQRFYRALLAGSTPAAALRRAQTDLLREYPHPFFWSAFTLVGRW
jgi:CHAT domain-containing protein